MDILNLNLAQFQVYLLILARMSGLFSTAPLLGTQSIPVQIKVAGSLFLSMLLFPVIEKSGVFAAGSAFDFYSNLVKETVFGLVVGFAASFVFYAIQMAGEFISRQMGLDMGSMFDPLMDTESSSVKQVLVIFASVLFLVANCHHWVIDAFAYSYNLVPLARVHFNPVFLNNLIVMSSAVFAAAVKICAPVCVVLFIKTVAVGIIEKFIPQMHIFAIGYSLQILIGFAALALFVPVFVIVFQKVFLDFNSSLDILLRSLKG
jgi:flagellar biosynthesis protein FliR